MKGKKTWRISEVAGGCGISEERKKRERNEMKKRRYGKGVKGRGKGARVRESLDDIGKIYIPHKTGTINF